MHNNKSAITLLNLDLYSFLVAKPTEKEQRANRLYNHLRNTIDKTSPKERDCFVIFMGTIVDECYKGIPLIPYFEKTIFTLHETLQKHPNQFVKDEADAKLISFFFKSSPISLENKKKLLNAMGDMTYLQTARNAACAILHNIATDYVKREQYKEDTDFTFVSSMGTVIDILERGQKRYSVLTNQNRTALNEALAQLKAVAPEATKPLIKKFKKKLSPIPQKRLVGISNSWRKEAFGEAPDALSLPRIRIQGLNIR